VDGPSAYPPFSLLSADQRIRALAGTELEEYRTGRAVFYQGDVARRAFLLLAGSVRAVMYRSDGSTLELGTLDPGQWLGLAELVVGGPQLTDAVARSPCRVLAVDRGTFQRFRALPGVSLWLEAELARSIYSLHTRVEVTRSSDRLGRWLADRVEAGGPTIEGTQDEIAAAVGLTRETVNRHLGRLQGLGLVRVDRGRVTVLDTAGLRNDLTPPGS